MIQIIIIGNLGRDAEVKRIGERDYISFSVASTGKENGEEVTRWISVLAGNNPNLLPYLKRVSRCLSLAGTRTRCTPRRTV